MSKYLHIHEEQMSETLGVECIFQKHWRRGTALKLCY